MCKRQFQVFANVRGNGKKLHTNLFSRYEHGLSASSIEVVEKMVKILNVNIDKLVFGSVNERMEKNIADREPLSMFQKLPSLEPRQLFTVKDFIAAYLLKADLQKILLLLSKISKPAQGLHCFIRLYFRLKGKRYQHTFTYPSISRQYHIYILALSGAKTTFCILRADGEY